MTALQDFYRVGGKVRGGTPCFYDSGDSYVASAAVYNGTCRFNRITGFHKGASPVYLWIYDGISALGTAKKIMKLAGTDNFGYSEIELEGPVFTTGIFVGISTSATTYTEGSADATFNVRYYTP